MSSAKKPSCFVISPIGESGSETRKRSDKVLAHVFEAALSDEYKITRADKISGPGMITSQILRALQDSELVIADLTEHNANVFYELAVRHAVEKPVIHVIDSRWKIPFDVAGFRTIVFDFTDLDSVADAIKQLKEQAHEIQAGRWGETPIKLANITRRSKQDPENTVLLKEAVEGVAALRSDLARLIHEVRTPLQAQIDYLTEVALPASSLSQTWSEMANNSRFVGLEGLKKAGAKARFYGEVPPSMRGSMAEEFSQPKRVIHLNRSKHEKPEDGLDEK